MTKEEREYALEHLKATTNETMKAVEGFSEKQLKFKPSEDSWSMDECVKHILLSEINIWAGFVDAPLATEPDSSRRSEVKMTDAQVVEMMENRTSKVTTYEHFNPKLRSEAFGITIKEFKNLRNKHISWAKEIDTDLRNRYAETPFGVIDVYQAIIFISAHNRRHVKQINEVMASTNFPIS